MFYKLAHPHLQDYYYPCWHPSTHSALYFTYSSYSYPYHCANFFTFPHQLKSNSLLLGFNRPLSSLYDFPHPCQSFYSERTQEACDRCMCREHDDRSEQLTVPGVHISCAQRSRWEGAQHSRMAFSQSLWNHGLCVCKVHVCQCIHMHACLCGFQDHMFTFSSLHICAGNNSSSPHRNDHSLSGLIRQLLNLNDVDVWDPSSVSLLYNRTQSPLPRTINSIFCSQKVQIYQPWIRSNKIVFPRVILKWWDHFLFIFSLIKSENMVILCFMFIVWLIQTSCRKQNP